MDTDSNADEEGADESQDGQDRPSPSGHTYEDAAVHCVAVRAVSAPSSPSGTRPALNSVAGPGTGLDCVSFQKAGERPSSLPPSSPRALTNNDWAYDSTVCPAEHQHPGTQKEKGTHTHTHTQSHNHSYRLKHSSIMELSLLSSEHFHFSKKYLDTILFSVKPNTNAFQKCAEYKGKYMLAKETR